MNFVLTTFSILLGSDPAEGKEHLHTSHAEEWGKEKKK
jgi:hypothetical protein